MRLYVGGYLTFYMPGQHPEIERDLPGPIVLSNLLAELGIPIGDVRLIIINGEIVDLDQAILNNKDEVKVFPGVDGG